MNRRNFVSRCLGSLLGLVGLSSLKGATEKTGLAFTPESASVPDIAWPLTPPKGVSYTEHKLTFVDVLVQGSKRLLRAATCSKWPDSGLRLVAGLDVLQLVETLPGFKSNKTQLRDSEVCGTLNGRWQVVPDFTIENYDRFSIVGSFGDDHTLSIKGSIVSSRETQL